MPLSIPAPSVRISVEPLTQSAFAPFGTVIENPARSPHLQDGPSPNAVSANQGTALKYLDVTHLTNFYDLAPSKRRAKAVMNMFVCSPRKLRSDTITISPVAEKSLDGAEQTVTYLFDVKILERHPFTPQIFIPLGLSANDRTTQYLVIVAPTLPASRKGSDRPPPYPVAEPQKKRSLLDIFSRARASPFTNEASPPQSSSSSENAQKPKGSGMPDLSGIRAFLANGSQAVTYGAGTWHAPMVVVGLEPVDFVVVQYANGVGLEDCQEVELEGDGSGGKGIAVTLETQGGAFLFTPGMLKAKL